MTSPVTLEQFIAEAEAYLRAHAPERGTAVQRFEWGAGEDSGVPLWEEPDSARERERLERSRVWRRQRFDAGYGWLDGPTALGGAGFPAEYARAYQRLERRFEVPDQSYFKLDHVVGPVVLKTGTEKVRAEVPRALQRGDLVACELFSEPEAGSDLFSARTRATPDGDGWRISGQKVWTSDAHLADIGVVFCRTGDEPGRSAFSAFLLDMDQPGVRVVPLRQMTGGAAFNEVFLDDAYVSGHALLGQVGQGWEIVREILARERAGIAGGMGRSGGGIANGERLTAMVKALGAGDDPLVRQQLVRVVAGFWAAKQLSIQGSDLAAAPFLRGDPAGLAGKLALSANLRQAATLVSQVLGARLTADTGEWGTYSWNSFLLGEPGVHIFAGTDEIVRNSLAERFLGMPRD
jgi:alkylation response protein AidB-like acyl-CoA dehydrogenase